jgi:hypothetical protein
LAPQLITIPTADATFRHFVQRAHDRAGAESAAELEGRLRRTYPRVVVRERGLVGEPAAWYVYRDGAWRDPGRDTWWEDPSVPRVETSADGWIEKANPTASGLLGLESSEPRHFTDFVVSGNLEDAVVLFEIVRATGNLEATVVLQPATGDALPIDLRVTAEADRIVAVFRLAGDVEVGALATPRGERPERMEFVPATDVAFRSYAERAVARMPEPTGDGLALRLRRLYPHAQVEVRDDGWIVRRDRHSDGRPNDPWWLADGLPRVRYDAMALILDANEAATAFFGRPLAGHHWQEFVTAGSGDEVALMLDILAEAGAAESRFRMPRGDGTLIEFDSYTVVEDGEFSTVFRPAAQPA